MNDHIHTDIPGQLTLDDPAFLAALDAELGKNIEELSRPNRAARRAQKRHSRRMFVRPDAGIKRMFHPSLKDRLTPYGVKEMTRRRKAAKAARAARKVERQVRTGKVSDDRG